MIFIASTGALYLCASASCHLFFHFAFCYSDTVTVSDSQLLSWIGLGDYWRRIPFTCSRNCSLTLKFQFTDTPSHRERLFQRKVFLHRRTWSVYFQHGRYISNLVSIFPTSLVYFQPYNLSTSTKCTPAHATSEARFQVRSPESALDLAAWLVNRAVDLGTSSLKK